MALNTSIVIPVFLLTISCVTFSATAVLIDNKFQQMAQDIKKMKYEIKELKVLQDRIAFLEKKLYAQGIELTDQKRQVFTLRQKLTDRMSDQTNLSRDSPFLSYSTNGSENAKVHRNRAIKKRSSDRRTRGLASTAFTAVLHSNKDNLGLGQIIKFDHVLLNDGNNYNPHTGVFVAPVSGIYLFAYHFGHGYGAGQVWLELKVNGIRQNAGVTDPYHDWQDLQGGNVAIIRLSAGDNVWVDNFHQSGSTLYGAEGFTSFSGVLLY